MAFFNASRKIAAVPDANPALEAFLQDYSIEVMPRTAAKIDDFRDLLPAATRVYIAHIEGTPIADLVSTARRLADE
ncbi:MAG: methylenetetrahydrofolate reductase, partial [Alphaproteobacteria bacterium]|nr:methylenetetrahydrofolate reductase [Alphaproteobacteria bacterium]